MEYPLVAVGGVILNQNKEILLVKRKNPPNKGSWAIPGGKVKFGETLEEAVKREIKEETNLEVEVKDLLAVIQIIKEGFHYVILDFICEVKNGILKPGSDAEDAKYFSFAELDKINSSPTTIDMLRKYFNGEKIPLMILEKVTQISM
ncbi:NUDIX hydrolase [Sulfurisphaera javensis]|uniref:NUDIX hydrolase n=1 Tax=Sulfurisphaera javensis TaxID=2049879 RepID=A0AAT9GNZ1_9CREN